MVANVQALPTPVLLGKGLSPTRSDAIFQVGGWPYWLVPAVRECDVERFARTGKAEFYRLRVYALTPDPTTTSGYHVGREIWSAPDAGKLPSLAFQVAAFRSNPASWIKTFRALRQSLAERPSPEPPAAPEPEPVAAPPATTGDVDGAAIRALRQRLGLTQAQLAERLGVSGAAVGFWETGRFRPGRRARQALERFVAGAGQ